MNLVADPLGPRSRGGCRSCAAEAAGAFGVATVLLLHVTVVAVLRGCCRCCKAGAELQKQLLQMSVKMAPTRTVALGGLHCDVLRLGDSLSVALHVVGVEEGLVEEAARWLMTSCRFCSSCCPR